MTVSLTIITVTFSPGRYLERFLDSIPGAYAGTPRVILADNGSTDGAPERAAAEREGVEFLPTGGNLGYGAAINRAAEAADADSEFLLIVNPDVQFNPGSIDALLDCARRHPEAGAIGPVIREPDGSAYPSARSVPTLGTGIGHALLAGVWQDNPWTKRYRDDADMTHERAAGWLSGSCLLVRRSAFEELGGFDERYFMYLEDVDFGDRLGRHGWSNILCPRAEITHAQGHAADEAPRAMLAAHHESAYRFQADRHPRWWHAPIRGLLKAGLAARLALAYRLSTKRKGK